MKDFIEMRIIEAVRKLLAGRVNEIINDWEENLPVIEFGNYQSDKVITPVITLACCEKKKKERIIKLDAYSLNIVFTLQDTHDGELHCYAYSAAVVKALGEDVTLGGVADRAEIASKNYVPPKNANCGEGWSVVISLKITVESMI